MQREKEGIGGREGGKCFPQLTTNHPGRETTGLALPCLQGEAVTVDSGWDHGPHLRGCGGRGARGIPQALRLLFVLPWC